MRLPWVGGVLLGAWAATAGWAGERVKESTPAAPTGVVEVVNVAGSISVSGWARDEVAVEGTLGEGSERLEFQATPGRVVVRVVLPRNCRSCEGSHLRVMVPAASTLQLTAVSAGVTVQQVNGPCNVKSVSGSVQVIGGAGEVDVRSVSGDVLVRVAGAPVRAKSVSGRVVIEGAAGNLEGSSVSGNMQVKGRALARADLSTTSGSMRLEMSLAPGARVEAKSVSGDITLVLPADTAAEFEVTTFSGNIRNCFGPQARRISQYTAERELAFTLGGGGARVLLKSFSGDVAVEKR